MTVGSSVTINKDVLAILEEAVLAGASDVHLVPGRQAGVSVMVENDNDPSRNVTKVNKGILISDGTELD